MLEVVTSHTTYEISINPHDAPAALASLIESGFVAERLEAPGSAAWIKLTVTERDYGEKFASCLNELYKIGGKLFSTGSGPMEAEVLFCDDDEDGVGPGINALREAGCAVKLLPTIDPYSGAIWFRISAPPRLGDFFDWVQGIVEPYGGDVLEADNPRSPRS